MFSDVFVGFSSISSRTAGDFYVSGCVQESNRFLYLSAALFVILMNDDIITDPHNEYEIFSIVKICNPFTCVWF